MDDKLNDILARCRRLGTFSEKWNDSSEIIDDCIWLIGQVAHLKEVISDGAKGTTAAQPQPSKDASTESSAKDSDGRINKHEYAGVADRLRAEEAITEGASQDSGKAT